MVDRRLFVVFLAGILFVSVLRAERARYDDLENEDEEDEMEFSDDNNNGNAEGKSFSKHFKLVFIVFKMLLKL